MINNEENKFVINDRFPDMNFRKAILENVLERNDGTTDIFESDLEVLAKETHLLIPSSKIHDLTGIETFKNLTVLDVSYNPLNEIDLSALSQLRKVSANNCRENGEFTLSDIKLPHSSEINYLDLSSNKISTLDLSDQELLKFVFVSDNKIKNINLTDCEDLRYLACNNNKIQELDVSDCYELTHLECDNNLLTHLSLENNEELMLLSCDGNNLNNLDVSQCKELQSLSCRYNNITSLDIKGLELETIKCDGNDKSSNELISGGETSKKIGIKEKLQQA